MSSIEFHSGKLIPINIDDNFLSAKCLILMVENGLELFDVDKMTENEIINKFKFYFNYYNAKKYNRDEYLIFNNKLYKVENHIYMCDEDSHFIKMFKESDGSISFITQFYNGGTCFDEMIEEELDKD